MLHRPRFLLATSTVAAVVVLSGCAQPVEAAAGPSPAGTTVPVVPVVEAHCAAEYQWYTDAAELVSTADAVLRVTATGPSRQYEVRADPPPRDQPPGVVATAITVRVTGVLKGDVAVGEEVEVQQGLCTDRPLPTGPGTDYVLALSSRSGGRLFGQLNEDQAAWQVDDSGGLHPVSPRNDIGLTTVDDLAVVAAAAGSQTPRP